MHRKPYLLLAAALILSMVLLPSYVLADSDPGTLPPGVTVLSSSAFASGEGRYLNIVGVVGNGTDRTRIAVRVVAYLYDASGRRVGYRYGYTFHSKLAPGERSPFSILATMPSGYDHYSLRVTSFPMSTEPLPTLTVSGVTSFQGKAEEGDEKAPPYMVVGEVVNPNDTPVGAVKVAAVFYDDDGNVINVQSASLPKRDLGPGEKEPFKLQTSSGPVSEHVEVFAACRKASSFQGTSLYTTGVKLEQKGDGSLALSGTVVNGGSSRVTFVQVIGALYDEDGNVLNAEYTYTYPLHLSPGASGTFGITFKEHLEGAVRYFVYPSER